MKQRSPLAVSLDDLRQPPKQGMQTAARLGYGGLELNTTRGDLDAARLSTSALRHVRSYLNGLGLALPALDSQIRSGGLTDPARAEEQVAKTRQVLELAPKLAVPVVTTVLGHLPDDPDSPQRTIALESLRALADHADLTGTCLAVDGAGVEPALLAELIHQIDCPLVRVCYDPGEMVMHGRDAVAGLDALGEFVAASHLRDAMRGSARTAGRETAPGLGQVDFEALFQALADGGYDGPHVVRRSEASDPVADLAAAREHLDRLLR